MSTLTVCIDQRTPSVESPDRFAPVKGDSIFRWDEQIATVPTPHSLLACVPVRRVLVFSGAVILPEIICSLIPNITAGGKFWGTGGMYNSIGPFSQFFAFICCLMLLPVGRRLIGNVLQDLAKNGVVVRPRDGGLVQTGGHGWFLQFAEAATRQTPLRCAGWLLAIFVWNTLFLYASFLSDRKQDWLTSPATPGSWFYSLHVGPEQPNLAGILHQFLFCVVFGYLLVVVARLFIVFACVCRSIADDESLHIIPTHPDGTGGFLPVGRASLFLSLFTLLAGIATAGLTFQVFLDAANTGGTISDQGMFKGVIVLWSLYVILGPLLLFLPLWPLRCVMIHAKREYLHGAKQLYRKAELEHRAHIERGLFDSAALEGQTCLATLIEVAANMGVWPFDRKTLLRFAGVFLSPLIPVISSQWAKIYPLVHSYLLPGQ